MNEADVVLTREDEIADMPGLHVATAIEGAIAAFAIDTALRGEDTR